MLIIKEVGLPIGKALVMLAAGVVTIKLPEFEFISDIIKHSETLVFLREFISIIGGSLFFWKSVVMINRRIKGTELDNKIKQKTLDENNIPEIVRQVIKETK